MASDLATIRTKVRRLTRSPSTSQITDDQINEYINTFILYDFPEELRLFSLRTTLTFYVEPYIDEYDSNNALAGLDDFKDLYISVHEPVYIGGRRVPLYQDRSKFYANYPKVQSITRVGTGDGVTTNFAGTLQNVPILKNHVLFNFIDDDLAKELHDEVGGAGPTNLLTGDGAGSIDYVSGAYTLNFSTAPEANAAINAHTVPYVAAMPQALLFFDNKFYVRPIPDQSYSVEVEVYKRPTALLADGTSPELEQWWQYIAIGAAMKILEDRTDFDTIAQLQPLLDKQKRLSLRKTLVQYSNDRVATIYTDSLDNAGSWWWNQR